MTSKLYLLDTNILVHLVRGSELWSHIRAKYQPLLIDPRPLISVVTAGELRSLAIQLQWGNAKLEQMEFGIDYFENVDISDPEILRSYAAIDAQTIQAGQQLGKNDIWIAATVSVTRATLLTTDRDFERIAPQFIELEWINPDTE